MDVTPTLVCPGRFTQYHRLYSSKVDVQLAWIQLQARCRSSPAQLHSPSLGLWRKDYVDWWPNMTYGSSEVASNTNITLTLKPLNSHPYNTHRSPECMAVKWLVKCFNIATKSRKICSQAAAPWSKQRPGNFNTMSLSSAFSSVIHRNHHSTDPTGDQPKVHGLDFFPSMLSGIHCSARQSRS